jgi:hypothetical protein
MPKDNDRIRGMNKDQIKREVADLLPEDTSDDLITRIATYVVEKYEER